MKNIIANALNCIMNAKQAGKKSCKVYSSKLLLNILEIMKKNDYVKAYKIEERNVEIEFEKINECKAIKPRFYVRVNEIEKYIRRFLPARDFGIIIISTNKGLLTHDEAIEKKIGGSLIAYCY